MRVSPVTALIVGAITAIMDTTIVAVGLPALVESLHAGIGTIQWVTTGYLLALALSIPFVSWAQTRFGGKRLWLVALGIFVAASTLCACSWNADALIAFRILQGLGGGVMLPLMATLAMQGIEPAKMARTMASVSLPAAVGPIVAPVLGGIVLAWLDWRWLFLINVPIGVVGLLLAWLSLPDDRPGPATTRPRVDIVGAVLLVPALAGLLYGLSNAHQTGGFTRTDVLVPGVAGLALLAGFVGWAVRRGGAALVDIRLFRVRSVRASSIALIFLGAALFSGTFLLPLYFQSLRGNSALQAGLLLIPQGVGSLAARWAAGRLVERFGARAVAIASFLVVIVATIPFAFAGTTTNLWLLGAVLFLRGLGLGTVFIPVMTVAYVDIPRADMPHASAIVRIAQQLGGAFGTAVIAVVLAAYLSHGNPTTAFNAAFGWSIGISAVALVSALLLPARQAQPVAPTRPAEAS